MLLFVEDVSKICYFWKNYLIKLLGGTKGSEQTKMPDWATYLLSGLLGALIGSLATLRAARWQAEKITQNHKEALKHQNDLLEKTFLNQLELQIAEHRLAAQLQLLRRLYEFFADIASPIYATGHNLRNDWAGQLIHNGKNEFSNKIAMFRDRVSDATRVFARILEENRHQVEIHKKFHETLSFQSRFFEPVQIMLDSIAKLPDQLDREILWFMEESGKKFGQAVDEFSKWVSDGKDMAIAMQSELLAGTQIQKADNDT